MDSEEAKSFLQESCFVSISCVRLCPRISPYLGQLKEIRGEQRP